MMLTASQLARHVPTSADLRLRDSDDLTENRFKDFIGISYYFVTALIGVEVYAQSTRTTTNMRRVKQRIGAYRG